MPAITFTTGGALRKSSLRHANERLVLATVRSHPGLSRVDISRLTGLSPSSLTFIVDRLKRSRILIEERIENRTQVGRRPTGLRLRPEAMMAIGVEVATPESRVVLADLDGRIVQTRTVSWHANHEVLFSRIHSAVAAVREQARGGRVLGAGVALPGLMDPATGRIHVAQNLGWFDIDAGRLIRRNLHLPFYYENNARLSALAERWFGDRDRSGLRNFVFVVAREGVGTGVIIDGQVLHGARAAAGEFGHATLYPDGKRCLCGNAGCWEQYVSAPALAEVFAELGGAGPGGEGPVSGLWIAERALAGDAVAREALRRTAVHVGGGLANIIRAVNPEAIVVGDYLAVAWDVIQDIVWEVLRSRVHQYYLSGLRILPSQHATESSLLGAVALVLARYLTTFEQAGAEAGDSSVLMRTSAG